MLLLAKLRIFVALEPVNMQLSFDRLAGLVRERLEQEPRTGATVVVFYNRRRTHLKLLWYDKSGYCLLYKRLDRGTFRIPLPPKAGALSVQVSRREVMLMLEGVDRELLRRARRRVAKRTA
jgi:transposase